MLQKSNKWSWHIVVKNTLQHEWKQNLKCWWKCLHTPGACKDHITKNKKKGVLKIKCLTFIWRPILMLGSSFKPEEWRHVIRVKKKIVTVDMKMLRAWEINRVHEFGKQTDTFFFFFFKYIKLTCKTWGRKRFPLREQRRSLSIMITNFTVHAFMCKSIQIQI